MPSSSPGTTPSMSESGGSKPSWEVPHPYGYAAALDSMGSISAPLLAATSAALLGIVLSSDDVRYADLGLLILALATLSFVATIQLTFWARRFAVTPTQILEWWPEASEGRLEMLRREQRHHMKRFGVWANRTRIAYNAGILLFLAALPVLLVPQESLRDNEVRLVAVIVAVVGLLAEGAWIVGASDWTRALDPFDAEDTGLDE
jgi:hypothetical protein